MKPSDALAYKQAYIERFEGLRKADQPPYYDAIHKPVLGFVRRCPTYYVASDMVTLAEKAAESLPATTVTETLLASSSGWMIYDRPFADFRPDRGESFEMDGTPVLGIAWECVPTPVGYNDAGEKVISLTGRLEPCLWIFPLAESPASRVVMPISFSWRELGSDLDDSFASDKSFERKFIATHLLMQQTLAWVESQHPPRHIRRSAGRRGLPASNITVIKLRKMEKAPEKESGDLVAWTHRWLVNGHWRQQWYPSTSEHRPVWISPHVKGPADKPFVAKDRVVAWVR